jgi:integrase
MIEAIQAETVEVAREHEHADDQWLRNLFNAAVFTGLRLGVVTDLRCGSVHRDGDDLLVFIGKDKNGEPLYKRLAGELAAVVEKRLEGRTPAAYLFPGPKDGTAYQAFPGFLKIAVEQVAADHPDWRLEWGSPKALGHPHGITTHSLRHTMGTLVGNSGASRRVVQTMGNWKTGSMADRYHHEDAAQTRAAEDRLAAVLHITAQSAKDTNAASERETA